MLQMCWNFGAVQVGIFGARLVWGSRNQIGFFAETAQATKRVCDVNLDALLKVGMWVTRDDMEGHSPPPQKTPFLFNCQNEHMGKKNMWDTLKGPSPEFNGKTLTRDSGFTPDSGFSSIYRQSPIFSLVTKNIFQLS